MIARFFSMIFSLLDITVQFEGIIYQAYSPSKLRRSIPKQCRTHGLVIKHRYFLLSEEMNHDVAVFPFAILFLVLRKLVTLSASRERNTQSSKSVLLRSDSFQFYDFFTVNTEGRFFLTRYHTMTTFVALEENAF